MSGLERRMHATWISLVRHCAKMGRVGVLISPLTRAVHIWAVLADYFLWPRQFW